MLSPERPPIEDDAARLQTRPARTDVEWRASRAASDVAAVVATLRLPPAVAVRAWEETDFPEVQRLSAVEGWTTPIERTHESLVAWRHSWPALVAVHNETVIGFSRAVGDGVVTTYIAELLVVGEWRGRGIATALLQASHRLCPGSRLDLLATSTSRRFYERLGFRPFAGFRWSGPEEIARVEEQGLVASCHDCEHSKGIQDA